MSWAAALENTMEELHPDIAKGTARTAMAYSASFDGNDWQSDEPWPHRIELAQALDWITELGAMVLNLADRVGQEAAIERAECIRLCKEHEARLRRAQFVAKADSVATVCDDIEQRGHNTSYATPPIV